MVSSRTGTTACFTAAPAVVVPRSSGVASAAAPDTAAAPPIRARRDMGVIGIDSGRCHERSQRIHPMNTRAAIGTTSRKLWPPGIYEATTSRKLCRPREPETSYLLASVVAATVDGAAALN